jgi:hypothetical protein
MRLRTLNADGSASPDAEFDLLANNENGEPYQPPVVIRCRVLTASELAECNKKSMDWDKNPATRGMMRVQNDVKAASLALDKCVLSWTGIEGSDGQPLVCNAHTKDHLPGWIRMQIADACTRTEAVDSAEGFRQSPDLVRVVG